MVVGIRDIVGPIAFVRSAALLVVVITASFTLIADSGSGTTPPVRIARVELTPQTLSALRDIGRVADTEWYRSIAEDGYFGPEHASGQTNWPFFPLFPLMTRPLIAIGIPFHVAATLLANLFLVLGMAELWRVASARGADADFPSRAVWLSLAYPFSYFLSLPLPESLFLWLSLLTFRFIESEHWGWAAVSGALMTACRPVGVIFVCALAIHVALARRLSVRSAASLAGMLAGIGGYALYLGIHVGNPLAFVSAQSDWNRALGSPLQGLLGSIASFSRLAVDWRFFIAETLVALALVVSVVLLAIRRQFAGAFYVAATIGIVAMSGSLQSLPRYATVLFPAFLLAASATRRPEAFRALLALGLILTGAVCVALALRVAFVMA